MQVPRGMRTCDCFSPSSRGVYVELCQVGRLDCPQWKCPTSGDEGSICGHFFLLFTRLFEYLDGGHSDDPHVKLIDSLNDMWWMTLIMSGEVLLPFGLFRHIFVGRTVACSLSTAVSVAIVC